jgi:hypothetical protein
MIRRQGEAPGDTGRAPAAVPRDQHAAASARHPVRLAQSMTVARANDYRSDLVAWSQGYYRPC